MDPGPDPQPNVVTVDPSPPDLLRDRLLNRLLDPPGRRDRLTHVEVLPARPGTAAAWPAWCPPEVVAAWRRLGVTAPWAHQAQAADLAWAGVPVVLATGTASGKSLAYLLPALTAVLDGARAPGGRGATALYVAPTKALAADQLRLLRDLALPDVRAGTLDGDTPAEERTWVREHAGYVLTNPDMLHHGLLPAHRRWAGFLRALRFVVVDECHHYRGVFGSHVAQVLRRLRRLAGHYGADPTLVLASATVGAAAETAGRLTGVPVTAVTEDVAPRGATTILLWEPPLQPPGPAAGGIAGVPARRSANAETAELLADLVARGASTLAFVRSRRGVEAVALAAQRRLEEVRPGLGGAVAAYRGGYLPEERRAVEAALHRGDLRGVAATNALELGVDVSGLDAVLLAGYPGTRASLWQQVGRAGRRGQPALAVLVARDDPLDTYLVHHPAALFGRPVEATVLDPDNPHVLAPHLAAAAAELPLTAADLATFGPQAGLVLARLVADGTLRTRPTGWYWTRRDRASDLADLRGTGGPPVRIVEGATGRLLGTVDAEAAQVAVHPGAVYVHQGRSYLVDSLDLAAGVALVEPDDPDYTTTARETSTVLVRSVRRTVRWGEARLHLGEVDVTSQVVGYLRRALLTGEVLAEEPLDLPPRQLRTQAVWWTTPPDLLAQAGLAPRAVPGAVHAAEHAAIGLLPLVATCDRWDVGGVSTAHHPDTGLATVFVYDGHPGGAGFAERAFSAARPWLGATRDVIRDCGCPAGCPSCVHSPKCGNGNYPLDKAGARRLLDGFLEEAPAP